ANVLQRQSDTAGGPGRSCNEYLSSMSGPATSSTTEIDLHSPELREPAYDDGLFASSLLIDWLLSIGLESFVEPLDDSRGKIRCWPIASNSDSRLSIRTADGSKSDSDRNTSTTNANLAGRLPARIGVFR